MDPFSILFDEMATGNATNAAMLFCDVSIITNHTLSHVRVEKYGLCLEAIQFLIGLSFIYIYIFIFIYLFMPGTCMYTFHTAEIAPRLVFHESELFAKHI